MTDATDTEVGRARPLGPGPPAEANVVIGLTCKKKPWHCRPIGPVIGPGVEIRGGRPPAETRTQGSYRRPRSHMYCSFRALKTRSEKRRIRRKKGAGGPGDLRSRSSRPFRVYSPFRQPRNSLMKESQLLHTHCTRNTT